MKAGVVALDPLANLPTHVLVDTVGIVHGAVMAGAAAVPSPVMPIIHVSVVSAIIPVLQQSNEEYLMVRLRITDCQRCVVPLRWYQLYI